MRLFVIFKHRVFFETCSRASFIEVLLQEWQEIGVAPFPPRSRFNGQGSKALQEYEKCIKRGVEPGGPQLPCRKQIFDLQRKGIELERSSERPNLHFVGSAEPMPNRCRTLTNSFTVKLLIFQCNFFFIINIHD